MFLTIISFIFVFGLMVVFHELGHFTIAKLNGIIVNEFSIGIGPKLFGKTYGETQYSLRAFPIGGYIKMEGEDAESENPRGFTKQSPWRRLSVIAAGPIMNFILAIVLLSIIAFSFGFPTTVIDIVTPDNPAEIAGMISGDRIVEIEGTVIEDWNQVGEIIRSSEGTLNVLIERDSTQKILTIVPVSEAETGRIIIGIMPEMKKSPTRSIQSGFEQTWLIVTSIIDFLRDLITGGEVEGEIIGPVGIIGMVGEAANAGLLSLLFIAAYLSINLGIINLLPFPALDGGRMIFIIFEILRGKPVPPEKEGFVHFVGFALLMALMVFILLKDIMSLF
jgi:regulator of sigma E protease